MEFNLIKLSLKETEQLKLLLDGKSQKEICNIMDVSLSTVKTRSTIILQKYSSGFKSINELVIFIYKNKIQELEKELNEIKRV